MEVQLAILADYVTRDERGKAIIIGVFDRLISKEAPIKYGPLFLYFTFRASISEGHHHTISVDIVDSDGQLLYGPAEMALTVVPTGAGRPLRGASRIHFPSISFPNFDDYQLRIWSKGTCLRTVDLSVLPHEAMPDSHGES